MTRFARAKGSKASNERMPNDATPWHVMKQQLMENLSKKQESIERTKSAKELLVSNTDTKTTGNSWAEFPNSSGDRNDAESTKIKKKKKKQQLNNVQEDHNESIKKSPLKRNISEVDNSEMEVKHKKCKKNKNHFNNVNKEEHQANIKNNESDVAGGILNNKKKRENKYDTMQTQENSNNVTNNDAESHNGTFSKGGKFNMKKRKSFNESTTNFSKNSNYNAQNNKNNDGTIRSSHTGDNKRPRKFNQHFANRSQNFKNGPNKFGMKKFNDQKNQRKPPKVRDDKEHQRRKPDLGPLKITINGVIVDIVKFDGFPVKKEDADRLRELKQKMIMKGIPKNEINAAMKLERRKAEKALARIKKCVCFHCRKSGHNLSDCPELGSEQAATGICFKCGSTEHTHFECKVAKSTEFRYATCFICREQGHIAKQCPDNPKGIYPQGGACKICGDVTHLKKDCPDLIKEKEESAITVNTITDGNLESLEESKKNIDEKEDKKAKKIVKF